MATILEEIDRIWQGVVYGVDIFHIMFERDMMLEAAKIGFYIALL